MIGWDDRIGLDDQTEWYDWIGWDDQSQGDDCVVWMTGMVCMSGLEGMIK